MLDPKDSGYGIGRLSSVDRDMLKNYLCSGSVSMPSNYKEVFLRLKNNTGEQVMPTIKQYYAAFPTAYPEDIIKCGALNVPYKLKNLSPAKLREKLTPVSVSTYALKCISDNPGYTSAIKKLKEKLGVTPVGSFDIDAGRRLYDKIKYNLPSKPGYLASEVYPDLLFTGHFEEYVVFVDADIWNRLGLDAKYLAKDSDGIWTGNGSAHPSRKVSTSDLQGVIYEANILIFQSPRKMRLNADGSPAEDLKTNDYTKDDLLAIDPIFGVDFDYNEDYLFSLFKGYATLEFTRGEMRGVLRDMIDHFQDGSGTDYRNETLTYKAKEHQNTTQYVNLVKDQLIRELTRFNGNVSALEYNEASGTTSDLYGYIMANRSEFPKFNTTKDKLSGLTITVNDTWGNYIEVRNYSKIGNWI